MTWKGLGLGLTALAAVGCGVTHDPETSRSDALAAYRQTRQALLECPAGKVSAMSMLAYGSFFGFSGPTDPLGNCWWQAEWSFNQSKAAEAADCARSNGTPVWDAIKYEPGQHQCSRSDSGVYSSIVSQFGLCCRDANDMTPVVDPPYLFPENRDVACQYYMPGSTGINAWFYSEYAYDRACSLATDQAVTKLAATTAQHDKDCQAKGGVFQSFPEPVPTRCVPLDGGPSNGGRYIITVGATAICCKPPAVPGPGPTPATQPLPEMLP